MKKILVLSAIAAIGLAVGHAHAADAKWDGFYAGVNAGGSQTQTKFSTTTVYTGTDYFADTSVPTIAANGAPKAEESHFVGGAQGGYNIQRGNMVFGLEGDFNAFNLDDTRITSALYPCCAPATFTIKQTASADWLMTVRPRLGFVYRNLLLYGTAGLALSNVKYDEVFTDTDRNAHETASKNETMFGWTVGGGAEYAIMNRWSLRAEYLYTDLGSIETTSTNLTANTGSYPNNSFHHAADITSHILRVGLNFRF